MSLMSYTVKVVGSLALIKTRVKGVKKYLLLTILSVVSKSRISIFSGLIKL